MKTVLLALALSTLPLAPASIAQTAAPATATAAKFTLETPIQDIVADEKGKAALEASVPGLTTHESYEMFKSMSLTQLSAFAADQLTPEVLATAEKNLAAVN